MYDNILHGNERGPKSSRNVATSKTRKNVKTTLFVLGPKMTPASLFLGCKAVLAQESLSFSRIPMDPGKMVVSGEDGEKYAEVHPTEFPKQHKTPPKN